jgi:hypothetical protein
MVRGGNERVDVVHLGNEGAPKWCSRGLAGPV